jgi:hypothetical protein
MARGAKASTSEADRPYPWVAVISMVTIMVAGIVFLVHSSCTQQSDVRGAGHAFLEALRENRIDEAYGMMARDVRRSVDRETFEKMSDIAELRTANSARFSASSVASVGHGCLRGSVVTPSGRLPLTLYMMREGDTWHVHTIELDARIRDGRNLPFSCRA